MTSFKLYWGSISSSGVAPLWVVDHLEVVEDIGLGGITRRIDLAADTLTLEQLEEAFGHGAVVAVAATAHAACWGTLRNRELAQAAKDIAAATALDHRPVADGQRVAGVYRRSVMLASGRFAMLDDGMGFSLVPWKPGIEQRLGQQLAATARGGVVSWEIDRQRGMGI